MIVTCRLLVALGYFPSRFPLNRATVSCSPQSRLIKARTVRGGALFSRLVLVLLIQDFAEALGHQVGPLCTAIVPLKILHWKEIRYNGIKRKSSEPQFSFQASSRDILQPKHRHVLLSEGQASQLIFIPKSWRTCFQFHRTKGFIYT